MCFETVHLPFRYRLQPNFSALWILVVTILTKVEDVSQLFATIFNEVNSVNSTEKWTQAEKQIFASLY